MNKDFALHLPYNNVSFGFVSTAISREICRQNLNPCIFPIGNPDLASQMIDQTVGMWLQNNINKSITFLETDACSQAEVNLLNNQELVFVTSQFTEEVMKESGVERVKYLSLGFDRDNFYQTNRPYLNNGLIVFGLFGKFEARKNHARCLNLWAKKFGNNPKYRLHCAIYNSFLSPEDNQRLISQALEGKQYWNITFLGHMKTNAEYNDYINSFDIAISMSGGEGFNLPLFHAIGLGKHAVALKGHAHLDYCDEKNAVLVTPNGKVRAIDNVFFHENSPWNTGNFFTYNDDDFSSAMEEAIKRTESNRVNTSGLTLQNRSYKDTVNEIIAMI